MGEDASWPTWTKLPFIFIIFERLLSRASLTKTWDGSEDLEVNAWVSWNANVIFLLVTLRVSPSPTVHSNCYYPKNKHERNKMTLQTATPPCIKASFNMLQSQSGLAAELWWQPLALKDSQNLPCVTNPTYSTLIALWYSSNEYSTTQEQSANKSFIEGLLLFHISQQTISTSKNGYYKSRDIF